MATTLDQVVGRLLADAAVAVHPEKGDKSFLEKRLAQAVAASLGGYFGEDLVVRDKKLVGAEFPWWSPQPGTIDVAVVTPELEPRIVFELKIEHVDQTLWDIYKMVSATLLPEVEAAYVVVAASPKTWSGSGDCVELFQLDLDLSGVQFEDVEWYSRFLFEQYSRAWQDLLDGGSGRLTEAPDQIVIQRVGEWPIPAFEPYELRAIRVWPGMRDEPLLFAGDWPGAVEVPFGERRITSSNLREEDLPPPDAPEQVYHEFALTFDGYRELGSRRRCANVANAAIDHWRATGELPSAIHDVRGCIFFEQRRWHHFGYGFDDERMSYLKALIARLRVLLATTAPQ